MDVLDAAITAKTMEHTQESLVNRLRAASVPCAPVQELDDVINDPHLRARGSLKDIEHPIYGKIVVPESPLRFADMPNPEYRPSVELGHDTKEILMEMLGLHPDEAVTLAAELQPERA